MLVTMHSAAAQLTAYNLKERYKGRAKHSLCGALLQLHIHHWYMQLQQCITKTQLGSSFFIPCSLLCQKMLSLPNPLY